ncbi:hypothetical protein JW710_01830 [Candidatus Dojkabacteria bacterium]|nr:hypothetical protein [Candidatus Dojkabacteria bacterium]
MKDEKQTPEYSRKDISSTEVELEITIPKDVLDKTYKTELENASKDFNAKGFRPGKAPKEMTEKAYGTKALESALSKVMPSMAVMVLRKEEILPVAPLEYKIENLDPSKPVKFKAVASVIPSFKIPSLKSLNVKRENAEVEDKEIDSFMKKLWQEHKGKAKNMDDKWVKETAKKLGFKSETKKDFEEEIKEAMKIQKQNIVNQQYSSAILAAAIKAAKIDVPDKAVEFEAEERERSFQEQLKQMKVSEEQFCQIRGVTMEQLKEQWKKDSLEALQNDIFLSQYSKDRKVEVTDDELKAEIDMIRAQSKDSEKSEELFDNEQWKSYIQRVLLKRKSFASFLREADPKVFAERPAPGNKIDKKSETSTGKGK